MGFSIAISGFIIIIPLMFLLMSIPGLVSLIFSIDESSSEISSIEESIYNTDTALDSLVGSSSSSVVNFTLNNNGEEKLWNFEKFTVLITFDGSSSGRLTEELSFAGTCLGNPSNGNWCIQSISNDILDTGILNEGEMANIRSGVSETLTTGATIVAVVTTDSGVTATKSVII